MSEFLSFKLNDEFVQQYADIEPDWGFPIGGGNSLGELTYLTKYSRVKEDGTKERWFETCRRVIEGMTSIQKDHCTLNRTPWNGNKAHRTAEDAYDRLFNFKWTPPGRGLFAMGTPIVNGEGNSAPLQNCGFISTEHLDRRQPSLPFVRLMEMSMFGIGVGFDTKGAGHLQIHEPSADLFEQFLIPDSREGWCESIDVLLRSYLLPGQKTVAFDYSAIRPAGSPLRRFGGVSAGPGPLTKLHAALIAQLAGRSGESLGTTDLVDIMNKIGKCVVAGNIRRSAEIALGPNDDKEFLQLKDWNVNPERMGADGWGHLSNNSVLANVGDNLDHLADLIALNGEPGIMWLDVARAFGRLGDPPNNRDARVAGCNPCAEQSLEHMELCTLVETYPTRHENLADFLKTVKVAYLYGKSVTLLPTNWPETNLVMTRNRRIGMSMTGVALFAERNGWEILRRWSDAAYEEVTKYDTVYSEWLGVRESIKKTSVKPSGTVSLMAGVWPGVHWPVAEGQYIRRQRFRVGDPVIDAFVAAGYQAEPDVMDPEHSVVVAFPTIAPSGRSEKEVSVWEKVALAVLMGKHWSDNMVSATFSFREEERSQIGPILRAFDGQLKTMSFLPMLDGGAYAQMPYEAVPDETFSTYYSNVTAIDWNGLYGLSNDAEGEKFCSNDVCELPRR